MTGAVLGPRDEAARREAAEHIAIEASRLARMASANDFAFLAYLIDMAVLEAWREATERQRGDGASRDAAEGDSEVYE